MTDTRIVTMAYRYKRPPKKRKAVAIAGSAIVRKATPKPLQAVDQFPEQPNNDDRKPAIVTTTSRKRASLMRGPKTHDAETDQPDPEADAAMRAWIERQQRPRATDRAARGLRVRPDTSQVVHLPGSARPAAEP